MVKVEHEFDFLSGTAIIVVFYLIHLSSTLPIHIPFNYVSLILSSNFFLLLMCFDVCVCDLTL